jgi:very-short-patch-repair endonuclease
LTSVSIDGRVFDLALFDAKVLIEFDGPYHHGSQLGVDRTKEEVAANHGFVVIRREVRPATVIDPETIDGL